MRIATWAIGAAGLLLVAAADPALAAKAEEITPFRYWWDFGWRIVNFLILAFLLVKVAKDPLKDFFKKAHDDVARNLQEMEEAKAKAQRELDEIKAKTQGLETELADFEKYLTETAMKEREELLADAKRDSEMIIENGKLWAKQSLLRARQRLAGEILDMAAEIATEKLRTAMTKEDQTRMVEDFTTQLEKADAA